MTVTGQILFTDRLAVEPGVAGDRRDRPTTLAQSMYFHSSSHVSIRKRASFDGATGVRHQQLRRRPALLGGATRVGNFDER